MINYDNYFLAESITMVPSSKAIFAFVYKYQINDGGWEGVNSSYFKKYFASITYKEFQYFYALF